MKLIAKIRDLLFTQDSVIVQLEVPKHYLIGLNKIDKSRLLDISINDKKSQRTLNQNAKLWALIDEINTQENGMSDEESKMELYVNLIKLSGIKIEYWEGLEVMKQSLEGAYRYVDIAERRISEKGKETCLFACYKGSSSFNTEEMSRFIEKTLWYAEQLGLDITYYVDELTLQSVRKGRK